MNNLFYVGLDVHKKTISYCVRQSDGMIVREGTITATRPVLDVWMRQLPQPWMAGMEATLFTGWIYDHLESQGATVKVGHSAMTAPSARMMLLPRPKSRKLRFQMIADKLSGRFAIRTASARARAGTAAGIMDVFHFA